MTVDADQTWADNNAAYPLSAARMNEIEHRIDQVAVIAEKASVGLVAPPTGVAATDTANIQSVLNEGPDVVQLEQTEGATNPYICDLLTLPTGVQLVGKGDGATTLRLATGATTDLIHTTNFESLKGGGTEGGVQRSGIRDLTLDGNRGNTTATANALFSQYGYALRSERVSIIDAPGHALLSEWGTGSSVLMESWLTEFKIQQAVKNGLIWNGPHDSTITDGQVEGCEEYDVVVGGHGNATTFDKVHCWGGQAKINWLLEVEAYLDECQGEDAKEAAAWIKHNGTFIRGGQFFNSPIGLKIGVASTEIAGTVIDAVNLFGCSTTCIDIAGNDWHGYYRAFVSPAAEELAKILTGSLASNSFAQIMPRNEMPAILQMPNLAIAAPAETTAANTKAIKEILKALGI